MGWRLMGERRAVTGEASGRVQGVFYRQSTLETANRLELTGWAKNCLDGSVEAVFEGERHAIEQAIEWCKQGPSTARVDSVTVEWQDFQGEFTSFIRAGIFPMASCDTMCFFSTCFKIHYTKIFFK